MNRRLSSLLIVAILALAGCSPSPTSSMQQDDDLGMVADFSLTERSGQTVRREDLLGKVWVAAFIFTRCAGPCLQVTGSMAHLQHDLAGEEDVRLVSFTVDPEYDTPKVLTAYAQRTGADAKRWLFLTGEEKPLYELITRSFKLGVEQNQGAERTPGNEVKHQTYVVVVDRRGHLRGHFSGTDPEKIPQIEEKVKALLQEKP